MLKLSRPQLPPGCVTDLKLDEWRAGELDEGEVQRLEQHLATCARCRARSEQLAADADDFLARCPDPPGRVAAVEEGRGHQGRPVGVRSSWPQRRARFWTWGSGAAGVAAAGVALLLWSRSAPIDVAPPARPGGETGGGIRSKGAARVGFVVRRAGAVIPGASGEVVYPGDQLRFFYASPDAGYLAILSRDGAGIVTEYYPGDGRGRAIEPSPKAFLDSSVRLDATLGEEQIWAIFCPGPFEVAPLGSALERGGSIEPAPACSVDRLDLRKQAP